jgi:TonB family protein
LHLGARLVRGNQFYRFRPPFIRKILSPVVLILLTVAGAYAQAPEPQPTPVVNNPSATNTGVEEPGVDKNPGPDEQARIERARALAAAHRLDVAAGELEAIRRTTSDEVVRNVISVMLMGIYLEEGKYVLAQSLLDENFRLRALGKDAALRTYFAIAGQAVNGARAHLARYRDFGINVTNTNLPSEALTDLDRLRSLMERMIVQAKEIAADRKAYDVFALLEDVLGIRLALANNAEDRGIWEREYAKAREGLASSQTQIASLAGVPSMQRYRTEPNKAAAPPKDVQVVVPEPESVPVATKPAENKPEETTAPAVTAEKPQKDPGPPGNTRGAGLLNNRATKRVVPPYPAIAKAAGVKGVVRVFVLVDETGKVTEVTAAEGPLLLRPAAEEAALGWRFSPTAIAGKTIRVSGYIEFNFTN